MTANQSRIFSSPLARRLAAEKDIDLASVQGSGPRGRIVKADILSFSPGNKSVGGNAPQASVVSAPSGPGPKELADMLGMAYSEIPNNNIKKITAQRLQEAKQLVPHFYLTVELQIDGLLEARRQINDVADGAYKLSVNDFVVKACALALRAYPQANVSWTEEGILQYEDVDVSVAVATPNGLMTPIVKSADQMNIKDVSLTIKDLASRAKDGKLKPEEFQGGTFTVSNLGMFGIKEFGAIINPPQSCILAVGAGEKKPYVDANGEIAVGTFMHCTLSVDHRSVDGAVGAEYLQILKKHIENPAAMLV